MEELYSVVFIGFHNNYCMKTYIKSANHFIEHFQYQKERYMMLPSANLPFVCVDGVTKGSAETMQKYMDKKYGCTVEIEKSETTELSPQEEMIQEFFSVPTDVRCPRCFSPSVSTGARGYSLITGFIGSGRTVNRCAKCGNSWTPGR